MPFGMRLMLRFPHLSGHNRSHVVVSEGLVRLVEDDLALFGMFHNTGFQVVTDNTGGGAAPELKHVDIAQQPSILFHVKAGFHIGVLAVGQCCHKEVHLPQFPGGGARQLHGGAGPVYLRSGARLVLQTIRQVLGDDIGTVAFAEPGISIGQQSQTNALIPVFLPQKLQGDPGTGKLTVDGIVVGLCKQHLLRQLVGVEELIALVEGQSIHIRVADLALLCDGEHLANGRFGHVVGACNFGLRQSRSAKLHDEFYLDFSGHGLNSFHIEY